MTRAEQRSGAWIFVSHSHHDQEKVRKIRNYLEDRGHNPLLFFLKCLDDDDARLPKLIRDEIRSRNWFVLCDSPNAKASKYVPEEIALVESLDGKSKETIDLTQDLESQLYKLDRLLKRATVFLSYARADEKIAKRIQIALEKHDYSVWCNLSIPSGSDWRAEVRSAIDEAVKSGFVLILMSRASLSSQWCRHETEYALHIAAHRSNIIPVIIAPFPREAMLPQLKYINSVDLLRGSFHAGLERLIRSMKTQDME